MEEVFVGHHGSPQRRFHFQYRSSLSYSVLSPSKLWFYSVVAVKKKRINMFTIRQDKVSCRLWWLLQKLCGQQLSSRTWCLLDLHAVPDIWWYKYIYLQCKSQRYSSIIVQSILRDLHVYKQYYTYYISVCISKKMVYYKVNIRFEIVTDLPWKYWVFKPTLRHSCTYCLLEKTTLMNKKFLIYSVYLNLDS